MFIHLKSKGENLSLAEKDDKNADILLQHFLVFLKKRIKTEERLNSSSNQISIDLKANLETESFLSTTLV